MVRKNYNLRFKISHHPLSLPYEAFHADFEPFGDYASDTLLHEGILIAHSVEEQAGKISMLENYLSGLLSKNDYDCDEAYSFMDDWRGLDSE
jgi:hypothetical protein